MKDLVVYYLIVINIISFISMGIDKYKAKRKLWRIPEKTLMTLAAIGGSIGMLLGMNFFRHKTKHSLFTVGGPLILIIHIGIAIYFIFK